VLPEEVARSVEAAVSVPDGSEQPPGLPLAPMTPPPCERLVSVAARGVAGSGPVFAKADLNGVRRGSVVSLPTWALDAAWINQTGATRTSQNRVVRARGFSLRTSYVDGTRGGAPPRVESEHAVTGMDGVPTFNIAQQWVEHTSSAKKAVDGFKKFYKVNTASWTLRCGAATRADPKPERWLQAMFPHAESGAAMRMTSAVLRDTLLQATGGCALGRERACREEETIRTRAASDALNSLLREDVSDSELARISDALASASARSERADAARQGALDARETARLVAAARLNADAKLADLDASAATTPPCDPRGTLDARVEVVEDEIARLQAEPRPGPGAGSVAELRHMLRVVTESPSGSEDDAARERCAACLRDMISSAVRHALTPMDSARARARWTLPGWN
jgi:hypothetical protein